MRTLVKRGDPDALRLLGANVDADVRLRSFAVKPRRIRIGDATAITFTLEVAGATAADVEIDYRVHYMGVRGPKAPKVFKLARRRLEPGQPVTLSRRHPFDHVTIRRIHPGPHTIDIQANGRVLASASIDVSDVPPAHAGDIRQRDRR